MSDAGLSGLLRQRNWAARRRRRRLLSPLARCADCHVRIVSADPIWQARHLHVLITELRH